MRQGSWSCKQFCLFLLRSVTVKHDFILRHETRVNAAEKSTCIFENMLMFLRMIKLQYANRRPSFLYNTSHDASSL